MKIYDKEALFMVILDFLMIAMALWSFNYRGPAIHNVAILLYSGLSIKKNIRPIFLEDSSRQRKKQIEKQKQAYKNVFGRFAPLAPFSFFIFLGIGLLLLKLLPGRMFGAYVILCGFFAPLFERIFISDELVRMDREQEEI